MLQKQTIKYMYRFFKEGMRKESYNKNDMQVSKTGKNNFVVSNTRQKYWKRQ